MGQNTTVTGMVLNVMPIGDYDKRVTLLTKERGKITAFARGARRQNSPLLAAANPFSFGEFEVFEGRSSYTLSKATIENYFETVQRDLEATYYGCYFLEFADYFCQENNDEREMLRLLYQSLKALSSSAFDNRLVRVVFELKAMAVNGQGPNVFSCIACGKKEGLSSFSVKRGGTLCASCAGSGASKDDTLYQAEGSTLYTMQYVIASTIEKLYTFTVSEKVLAELQKLMREYMNAYLGHSFQALKILEETEQLSGIRDFTG